jgi:hypothetical protein
LEESVRYQVVNDNLRQDESEELLQVLGAGKTAHVTGVTNADLSAYYSRALARFGRRLRRKQHALNGKDGYLVWLEEPDSK